MSSDPRKVCVVAAGGTGGHMFPAEALSRELTARGWRIVLATDARGERYAAQFPAEERLALDAATGRGPLGLAKAGRAIGRGVFQARAALSRLDAAVVVGFGGYPSAPALVAALSQRRPTLIHEQNSVLGRTNRMLAPCVDQVLTGFPETRRLPARLKRPVVHVGNPVRDAVCALHDRAWAPPKGRSAIRILATGGSQGARLLSEAVPQALAALPQGLKGRLEVWQQARPENLEAAQAVYGAAGIRAEVAPFFSDMAERLARAHLVIGRAGASTCAELTVAALPSILVPFKAAMDDHQTTNARLLEQAGAAVVISEDDFTPETLARVLAERLGDSARLAAMSAAARSIALPDAAIRLADQVETVAGL